MKAGPRGSSGPQSVYTNPTPLLFGRSWLQAIQFCQGQYAIQVDVVDELKTKYPDIFKQELGTVRGMKAALYIKDNVKPVFCKAR